MMLSNHTEAGFVLLEITAQDWQRILDVSHVLLPGRDQPNVVQIGAHFPNSISYRWELCGYVHSEAKLPADLHAHARLCTLSPRSLVVPDYVTLPAPPDYINVWLVINSDYLQIRQTYIDATSDHIYLNDISKQLAELKP